MHLDSAFTFSFKSLKWANISCTCRACQRRRFEPRLKASYMQLSISSLSLPHTHTQVIIRCVFALLWPYTKWECRHLKDCIGNPLESLIHDRYASWNYPPEFSVISLGKKPSINKDKGRAGKNHLDPPFIRVIYRLSGKKWLETRSPFTYDKH